MTADSKMPTVLVADNERDIVDTTAVMLETCDYKVLKAYSADEALVCLDEHPEIALVLSDIRMPEVDGFDLLRVIRHRFRSLPVVLMTGLPVTHEDIIPVGATILNKPFTYGDLQRVLMSRLSPGPGAGALDAATPNPIGGARHTTP